MYVGMIM